MLTKEDPGDKYVRIVPILVDHIAKGQKIQLLLASFPSRIHGEKDRPSDATANETSCRGYLEITQEQEGIE